MEKHTVGLTEDQRKAFEAIVVFLTMEGGAMFLLKGYAGTGKTYLMGRVLDYINDTSLKSVALTAPTHKALKVLSKHTKGTDLFTTHAFLAMRESKDGYGNIVFKRDNNAYNIPSDNYQVVIVDETSQVPDEIFEELENLMGKKIIFVGDPLQIPPVNQLNSLPFEVEVQKELNFHIATLNEIVRQAADHPIIKTSMKLRESIYRPIPGLSYENDTNGLLGVKYVKKTALKDEMERVLDMFQSPNFEADPDYIKIMAWTNTEVNKYNKLVRGRLFGENIPKLVVGDKLVADAPIMEGKQFLVKNSEDMEVLKVWAEDDQLDKETHLKIYKAKVSVFGIDDSREVIIPIIHEESEPTYNKYLKLLREMALLEKQGSFQARSAWITWFKLKERYADVKYAYAITAHKSQGSTYDHGVLMLYDMLHNRKVEERNRIMYTACTRPRYTLTIVHT